jgi:ABC-type transport system involved in multi-copper enzyme maturation permease subunit
MGTPIFLLGLMTTWVTAVWLLCVGTLCGVLLLAAGWLLVRIFSSTGGAWVVRTVREGVLSPMLILLLLLSAVSVFAFPLVPSRSIFDSLKHMGSVGSHSTVVEIPAAKNGFEVPIPVLPSEVQRLRFSSNKESLRIDTHLMRGIESLAEVELKSSPDKSQDFAFEWKRTAPADRPYDASYRFWPVTNLSDKTAKLHIDWVSDVEFPEVRSTVYIALAIFATFALYLLAEWLMPRVSAVALTTARESMGQTIYYLLLAVGTVLLCFLLFVPYNTFGEDIKMYKDCGLTLVKVFAMLAAVWSASVSVADEIDGRTALTVLSKPIQRWQFILGKYLGILWPVLLMFFVLGTVLLISISYKVVYDSRESASTEPAWQLCFLEMMRTVPGLLLGFMETMVMAAISVAISTRLPMMANLIICFAIYALGNLAPMFAQSTVGKFEIVRFIALLLSTALPVLEHLNMTPAIAGGVEVPWAYLGMAFVYCLLYSCAAMLLALALFEDRDLA